MARLFIHNTRDNAELDWIESVWRQPIQRIFWIYRVPATDSRGRHHHRSCQMVLHCVTGSVEVYVQTPTTDQQFTLNSSEQYLFLDPQDWRMMHQFSQDVMLTVFASLPFETTVYYETPYRSINLTWAATANQPMNLISPLDTAAG